MITRTSTFLGFVSLALAASSIVPNLNVGPITNPHQLGEVLGKTRPVKVHLTGRKRNTRQMPAKFAMMTMVDKDRQRKQRRALPAYNEPLQDYYNGTDIQWYGPIGVGTPAQNMTVFFDTGSVDVLVASTKCGSECAKQKKFDGTKSSTFTDYNYVFQSSTPLCSGVEPVQGSGCTLTLDAIKEVVSLGPYKSDVIQMYLIVNQTSQFQSDPFDGLLGLGSQPGAFFKSLQNQGLPSLFGFYITPNSVGSAELTLGGTDTTKYSGTPTFIPLANTGDGYGFWELKASKVSVNGKTTTALSKSMNFVMDTGQPNLVFPTSLTNAIYALISTDIKPYAAMPGAYSIACSKIPSLPAVISFTFTTTSGSKFDLSIPSSELSVGPIKGDTTQCQTLINAADFGFAIVGGSLLKHYYSIWDVGNQKMGWVKNSF